jgi:hypothetical protein
MAKPDPTTSLEIWAPVSGFEKAYSVSSHGRIRRDSSFRPGQVGCIRKSSPDRSGYLRLVLSQPGKKRYVHVHHVVAEAFLGPRPVGLTVNHRDGDKKNNHAINLEYLTPALNSAHAARLGLLARGSRQGLSRLTEEDVRAVRRLIAAGSSDAVIANRFGVAPATVWFIRTGKTWKHAH